MREITVDGGKENETEKAREREDSEWGRYEMRVWERQRAVKDDEGVKMETTKPNMMEINRMGGAEGDRRGNLRAEERRHEREGR